jgi:hypothetical protein
MTAVFLRDAMARIDISARNVIGACLDGNARQQDMASLRHLVNYDPIDSVQLRRSVAARLLAAGSYSL